MREVSLLGYSFFGGTLEELLESVEKTIVEGKKLHIVTVNPEMLVFPDPQFRKVLREAEIRLPDGIGVVWASRFLGCGTLHRLAGIEVAEALMERGNVRGWSFYFLGAREEVVKEAVSRLRHRYPHLLVYGFHHGYFTEDGEVLEDIHRKCPNVLFVGMGVPRQEMWIARYRDTLPVSVFVGVGGSFDVWAGELRRAPTVFRRLGLEWLWRVLQEPKRLCRVVPAFLRFGFALLSEKWWRG